MLLPFLRQDCVVDVQMAKMKKRQSMITLETETVPKPDNVGKEDIAVLQELMSEEAGLMKEKGNLMALKDKLELKLLEEIDIKKKNIQKLRADIADLKVSCEKLAKSIKVEAK
jgi:uncharacterized protein YoxC